MYKMSLARILGKGIWQQGAQLRTVSVHMLAMVQMEWRGQSFGISRADGIRLPGIDLVRPFTPWAFEGPAAYRQAACPTCAGRYRRVKVAGIDDAIAANHAFRNRNTNAEVTSLRRK
jgi:hypothetical protein